MIKDRIIAWAEDRGILEKATPQSQMLKTVEEVGELANAIATKNQVEIVDAIGDIVVTLVIQAELNGLDFDECVEVAYKVISKRKGKMINGMFVKEQINIKQKGL